MSEPLSDDARVVLACIRDHYGITFADISVQLGLDKKRVWTALQDLIARKLIEQRFILRDNSASNEQRVGVYLPT